VKTDDDRLDVKTLYQKVKDRAAFHERSALRYSKVYKGLGFFLTLFIPSFSAVLSYLTGLGMPLYILGTGSVILTISTIVQSSVQPREKFVKLSKVLIDLYDWKLELDSRMGEMSAAETGAVLAFLRAKNAELSQIGRSMSETTLPRTVA